MQRLFRLCVLAGLLSFTGLASYGQGNPGTPSWVAYDKHENDSVNLQNLNVVVNVPVYSKSGAFPFTYSISGTSFMWVNPAFGSWWPAFAPYYGPSAPLPNVNGGLLSQGSGYPPYGKYTSSSHILCPNGTTLTWKYTGWYIWTADGTKHYLPSSDYADSVGCYNAGFTDQATDGTGLSLTVNLPNGGVVQNIRTRSGMAAIGSALTDSNG